jgi:hypothetical protein
VSVRAYGIGEELCLKSDAFIDEGNNAFFLMHSSNRWLQVRLDGLAAFTLFFVCFFIILGKKTDMIEVDSGTAGLLITFVQMVTGLMNWTVRMGCETEARITSVERIVEYSEIQEVEAAPIVDSYRPPANWPEKGDVSLQHLSMRWVRAFYQVRDESCVAEPMCGRAHVRPSPCEGRGGRGVSPRKPEVLPASAAKELRLRGSGGLPPTARGSARRRKRASATRSSRLR